MGMMTERKVLPVVWVRYIPVLGLVAALSAPLEAAPIVLWGGTGHVSADTELNNSPRAAGYIAESAINGGTDVNGDGDTLDKVASLAFSETAPLNPTSGYTGPTFHGGFLAVAGSSSATFEAFKIVNNAAGDYLWWLTRHATTGMPVVFDLAQFDASADHYQAGPDSTLSVDTLNGWAASGRFLVRNAGQYYLSEAPIALGGNNDVTNHVTTSIYVASTMWAPYALADGNTDVIFSGSAFSVSGSTFTDIDAIGWYTYVHPTAAKFGVSGLRADLVAVPTPEPGTLALLLAGGCALTVRRRRRA